MITDWLIQRLRQGGAVDGQLSGKFLPALDEVGIAGEICDDALNGLCLGINEAGDRISQINFGSLFGGFGYLLHRRFQNVEIVAFLLDAVVKKLARHDSNIENRIFFKIEGGIEPFSLSATVTNPGGSAFFSVTSLPHCSLSGPEGLSQMSASPAWLLQSDWLGWAGLKEFPRFGVHLPQPMSKFVLTAPLHQRYRLFQIGFQTHSAAFGDGMKNILVAGGCGFIGSHLVDRLLKRRDIGRLVVVDNLWTGLRRNLSPAVQNDPRLRLEICDVEALSSDMRFDEILHLASPASPPWYMRQPQRVISANVLGAMHLLKFLKPGGRFSYTSTSEVYGDPLVSPQPESYRGSVDCTGPRSSYDESKRCTEALLFECQRVDGLDIRVVRLFNVYGPRTRPDDGRAVSNFLTQALTSGELTVYGDGLQSRSWGYVDDIVDGLERFFWADTIHHKGPLNIGNDREISVLDVARYVTSLIPGTRIIFAPPVPQDPTNRRPDLTLARRVLPGWDCAIPYEEGVCLTLDWFLSQLSNGERTMTAPEPVLV